MLDEALTHCHPIKCALLYMVMTLMDTRVTDGYMGVIFGADMIKWALLFYCFYYLLYMTLRETA